MNCYITNYGLIITDDPIKRKKLTMVEKGMKMGQRKIPDKQLKGFRIRRSSNKSLLNIGINAIDLFEGEWNIINTVVTPEPDLDKFKTTIEYYNLAQRQVVSQIKERFQENIKKGGAVLKVEAGCGKTFMGGKLISKLGVKTLIVISKNPIGKEWRKMLSLFPNIQIGEYSAKVKVDGDVVIMNVRSVCKDTYTFRADGEYITISNKDYMAQFGFVIYDEVHNYTTETFSNIFFRTCFRYRLGLSATPERSKSFEPLLYWNIGPLIDVNHYWDDENKTNWVGEVQIIKYYGPEEYTVPLYNGTTISFGAMVQQFESDPIRHKIVLDKILDLWSQGRKIIVFVEHTDYCEKIMNDLIDEGANVDSGITKLIGGTKDEKLDDANNSSIIVGTYGYMSEGISYKQLDTIVLATPRKSNMQQILHRVMRTGGDESIKRIFVDFVDTCTKNFISQHSYRKKTYKKYNFTMETKIIKFDD